MVINHLPAIMCPTPRRCAAESLTELRPSSGLRNAIRRRRPADVVDMQYLVVYGRGGTSVGRTLQYPRSQRAKCLLESYDFWARRPLQLYRRLGTNYVSRRYYRSTQPPVLTTYGLAIFRSTIPQLLTAWVFICQI